MTEGGTERGRTVEDLRRHNLSAVLACLHAEGPLRRAELTARLRLNRSTIADLVAQLCEEGLLTEVDAPTRAGVGRPSPVVQADPDGARVLAASLHVDHLRVGLFTLGGTLVARRERRLGNRRHPPAMAALVADEVGELLRSAAPSGVAGIGVSVPGLIRHEDGTVRLAPNLGWVDEPFAALVRGQLADRGEDLAQLPVQVGNDADLGLLAEHRRGAARGLDDVLFIAGETGVGGSFITGGQQIRGVGGYAGELGHMVIRAEGSRCHCGGRGCWETEIGAGALIEALGLPERTQGSELIEVVRALPHGAEPLRGLGRALGTGIVSLVNLFNPRLVVIGGLLGEIYPWLADQVDDALRRTSLVAPAEQVEVTVPHLGADAALFGAAELIWNDLIADPVAFARRVRRTA